MKEAALLLADTALAEALVAALGDPALAARIVVDFNTRARHVGLRVDVAAGCIVLCRPRRISDKAVMRFVASRKGWIARHLATLAPRVVFADGAVVPYLGEDHVIRWRPEAKGGVWRDEAAREIVVTGRAEHAPRRLRDWFKAEAREVLAQKSHAFAGLIGMKVTRVGVRDTRSRWGSCTRVGRLSFSWRLIFVPAPVLAYVAAHEVAHLVHMNHSPKFWRTVAQLLEAGGVGIACASARAWLRRSGAALHRYG